MLTVREPGGVNFGGVQHIAAGIKTRLEDFFRGRFVDSRSKLSGAKAKHRRIKIRVRNRASVHLGIVAQNGAPWSGGVMVME